MKNLFFVFIGLLFINTSCVKEEFADSSNFPDADEFIVGDGLGGGGQGYGMTGSLQDVDVVSGWLKFENKDHFNSAVQQVALLRASPENEEKEKRLRPESDVFDPDPLLGEIEDKFGIISLRKKILLHQTELIEQGYDSIDLTYVQNYGISDIREQALFNENGIVQIGDTIIKHITPVQSIAVKNNVRLMTEIIENGTEVIFEKNNIDYVDFIYREAE